MRVYPTVTASTIIADLNCGRKVRCHRVVVERPRSPEKYIIK
jgi:hypothetical protein